MPVVQISIRSLLVLLLHGEPIDSKQSDEIIEAFRSGQYFAYAGLFIRSIRGRSQERVEHGGLTWRRKPATHNVQVDW